MLALSCRECDKMLKISVVGSGRTLVLSSLQPGANRRNRLYQAVLKKIRYILFFFIPR